MNTNRITSFAYNADGKLLTLTARNNVTGDQVTRFVYGTTLEDSGIASNELLRAKIYPDSDDDNDLTDGNDGVYDRVEYKYNRLGEMIEAKDQAETVHAYDYDKLGRITHDRVTNLGPGVDDAVLRISREYEVRGMLSKITSYDNAAVGSGSVVNEVALAYNDFGQLATDKQAHAGAVGGETPLVGYDYANGANNTVRPTGITYPDSRALTYYYGTTDGMDDVLSRIAGIKEGNDTLAAYTRLGMDQVVNLSYPEPAADMTFIKQAGELVGDAGDQYTGLDRFGRVEDIRCIKDETHLERIQHGYDRAGNKRWRQNLKAESGQDEFYNYDELYQLTELQRGDLNTNRAAISGIPTKQEDFTYDPTGNWQNYLTKVAGAVSLDQNRTHNQANETWQIDGSNATVACGPTGNMVRMPKVGDWSTGQDLTWDAWNRLVKITEGETTVAQYAYDGLFRRTVKTLPNSDPQHFYYSSQWQVLEVREAESGEADRQFVWGLLGVDDLILRDQSGATVPRLYAVHDIMHVTAVMNSAGAMQERYGYDAFGNTRVMNVDFAEQTASGYDWEVRFCGYRWDGETGLYQVRYRYLHSGLGRWLSRDPIEESEGDADLYRYVRNRTADLTDPLGLRPAGNFDPCLEPANIGEIRQEHINKLNEAVAKANRLTDDQGNKCYDVQVQVAPVSSEGACNIIKRSDRTIVVGHGRDKGKGKEMQFIDGWTPIKDLQDTARKAGHRCDLYGCYIPPNTGEVSRVGNLLRVVAAVDALQPKTCCKPTETISLVTGPQ